MEIFFCKPSQTTGIKPGISQTGKSPRNSTFHTFLQLRIKKRNRL